MLRKRLSALYNNIGKCDWSIVTQIHNANIYRSTWEILFCAIIVVHPYELAGFMGGI